MVAKKNGFVSASASRRTCPSVSMPM
jgi:hypothetical protein